MKYLLFISIFLLSLLNHTTYAYVPAMLLLVFYTIKKTKTISVSKQELMLASCYTGFIIISALYFLVISDDKSDASVESFYNNLLFSFILYVIIFSLYRVCSKKAGISDLKFAVSAVLAIHIVLFFTQMIIVYLTDYYIDFIHPITGESSRYINYILGGELSGKLNYRATGLYVEPSTYASAITCIIMAGISLNVKKSLIYISTITILLNFSTIGVLLFIGIMFALFFNRIKIKYAVFLFLLALLLSSVNYDFIFKFINDLIYKFDVTSGSRYNLISMIYFDKHGLVNIFGAGYFNIPNSLYKEITLGEYSIAALNDAGLISYLVLKFGVLIIIPIVCLFWKIKGASMKILFCCILISKISFVFPILYLAIIPALVKPKESRNKISATIIVASSYR